MAVPEYDTTRNSLSRPERRDWASPLFWGCLILLLAFIIIPIASIFFEVSGTSIVAQATNPSTVSAITISLVSSTASLFLTMALGIPTSRFLSRHEFGGKGIIDTFIDLPIVLPPAVAGLALLLAFAPYSPIGRLLLRYGVILPGNIAAVVLAETFVAMPFFIRSSRTAFEEIDPRIETAASVLSPSRFFTFRKVVLPLASRGLIAGAIMAWGRAMGEFGATLLFAGNLPGITQTMPLAIYLDLEENVSQASFVSAVLVVISFVIIASTRWVLGRKRV